MGGSWAGIAPSILRAITFLAVPITVDPESTAEEALALAAPLAAAGAQLIEWRVDELAASPEVVIALVEGSPLPCIVTCRSQSEGGAFGGIEADRAALFAALAEAGAVPRYVDVEAAAWTPGSLLREPVERLVAAGAGLILSSHDFDGRPADLLQRVERIEADDVATVSKVVWRARSLRDNLEAAELLAARGRPMIALCMSEFGLISRVLAPKFGGFLTFASAGEGEESAPGQVTLELMRDRYRFESIGRETRVYGIIGWPLGHSRSPELHNAWFDRDGVDAVYVPLPIAPGWEPFKATLGALLEDAPIGFSGASATLPHKEHLLRYVREAGGVVDPLAASIGAANTLVVRSDGTLEAKNTDAPALLDTVIEGLDGAAVAGRVVAVFGAGGVARAAVAALADAGARVDVYGRTPERVAALVEDLSVLGDVRIGDDVVMRAGMHDVYVNGTPLGMTGGPAPEESPLAADVPLDEDTLVFDTVYAPETTPLLAHAVSRGARAIGGWPMFERQAVLQYEAWAAARAGS